MGPSGVPGLKGETGDLGLVYAGKLTPGEPGKPGTPGFRGRKGEPGSPGTMEFCSYLIIRLDLILLCTQLSRVVILFFSRGQYCRPGVPGESGQQGQQGSPGPQGLPGFKGLSDTLHSSSYGSSLGFSCTNGMNLNKNAEPSYNSKASLEVTEVKNI